MGSLIFASLAQAKLPQVYSDASPLTVKDYPAYAKIDRSVAADEALTEEQAAKLRSPQLAELTQAMLAVTKPAQLDALLVSTQAKLAANDLALAANETDAAKLLPDDYVFFASQLVLFRNLRGLVWKMIPVVQPYRVSHSGLLTIVRNVAKNTNTFFPRDTWKAGFTYLTEPFSAQDTQFKDKDHADLIQFFTKDLSQSVSQAYARVNGVAKNFAADLAQNPQKPGKTLLWDSQLAYGAPDTFRDGHYRFKVLGASEVSLAAGNLALAMANLRQASAYNLQGGLQTAEIVARGFGFDGLLKRLDGATDEQLVQNLREARGQYPGFLMLRENGADLMKQAYASLVVAYGHLQNAWVAAEGRADDGNRFLNPGLLPDYAASGRRSLKNLKTILGIPVTTDPGFQLRSLATGEVVSVNLQPFFLNPPKDLFALLPTDFDHLRDKCPAYLDGQSCLLGKVRNYAWGSAAAWNYGAHSYFPGVKDAADFKKRRRILSESSTVWPAALLLTVAP